MFRQSIIGEYPSNGGHPSNGDNGEHWWAMVDTGVTGEQYYHNDIS